jgi:hypothetical protein
MRDWTKIFKVLSYTLSLLTLTLYVLSIRILDGWIAVFLLMAGGITGVLSIITILLLVARNFVKHNHSIGNYIPAILLLTVVLFIRFDPIDGMIEKAKSPIIMHGYCEHTVSTVSITLRQDLTFEHNPGAFLTKEKGFGTYRIKEDSVFLFFHEDSDGIAVNDTLTFDNENIYEIGNDTIHLCVLKLSINEYSGSVPNNK